MRQLDQNKFSMRLLLWVCFLMLALTSKLSLADELLSNERLEALGIKTADIKSQINTSFAMTSIYSLMVEYKKRDVVLTKDTLYVVTSDDRGIELALPLSRIESAGIGNWGIVGHLRNIELRTDVSVVVFTFGIGKAEVAEKFFADLTSTGIQVGKVEAQRGPTGNMVRMY